MMRVLIVTNMYPTPANPKAGTFIEQQINSLTDAGIDNQVVLVDRANLGKSQYLKTSRIVRRAFQSYQPDLVHVMYGGILAALVTRAIKTCPVIVSFCGVDLLGADYGSLAYRIRTKLGVIASRYAACHCHGIIVKSMNLFNGLPAKVDKSIVRIVPNGVSLSRFQPEDMTKCREILQWNDDSFIILFSTANRANTKKRLPLAEKAVEILKQKGHRIEIKGLHKVQHDKVAQWINAADMTLLTSRSDEGSPNIIKETLACDKPVVSLDVGDVRERIENVKGCYICGETPDEIAFAVEKVINGKRRIDGRSALQNLSLPAVASQIRSFYEEIEKQK